MFPHLLLILIEASSFAAATPDALKPLFEKEEALPPIAGKGKTIHEGLGRGLDFSTNLDFLLAGDGRYRISQTGGTGTRTRWADEGAYYELEGGRLAIHPVSERSTGSILLRSMFFPAKTILSPLIEDAEGIHLVSQEKDDTTERAVYSYSLKSTQGPQATLIVELGDAGNINEFRISDGTSQFETVYLFSDYTEGSNDTSLPQHFHLFLQRPASVERPASTRQEIVKITLESVKTRSAEAAEFTPDLENESNITDYRKGLPKLRKNTGRLLEDFRDYIGF